VLGQVFGANIRRGALLLGGPVQMVFLAAGLFVALRVFREFGFHGRLTRADWALAGMVGLFLLCRFGQTGVDATALAGYPILCVLVVEARLLRRSVASMGRGLIAKCWGALSIAVLASALGEAGIWLMRAASPAWPIAEIELYIRFLAAVAFALAPAYLVAAQCRATQAAVQSSNAFRQPRLGDAPAM
jgi:hypothetical protein